MGTNKEEKEEELEVKKKIVIKTCLACLCSFLVSMVGGLILTWWNYVFHPTNRQLWLVPFGLILLVTPVLAWFAAFISETSNCNKDDDHEDDDNGENSSKITLVV